MKLNRYEWSSRYLERLQLWRDELVFHASENDDQRAAKALNRLGGLMGNW